MNTRFSNLHEPVMIVNFFGWSPYCKFPLALEIFENERTCVHIGREKLRDLEIQSLFRTSPHETNDIKLWLLLSLRVTPEEYYVQSRLPASDTPRLALYDICVYVRTCINRDIFTNMFYSHMHLHYTSSAVIWPCTFICIFCTWEHTQQNYGIINNFTCDLWSVTTITFIITFALFNPKLTD